MTWEECYKIDERSRWAAQRCSPAESNEVSSGVCAAATALSLQLPGKY